MKKLFLFFALSWLCLGAFAQKEVYSSFNESKGTLTYYYDDQRAARTAKGETTNVYDPVNKPKEKPFDAYRDKVLVAKIDVSMKDVRLKSTRRMFYDLYEMTEIQGMKNLVTDDVTDMGSMFEHCSSLQYVEVSLFNTENVTDMSSMFERCTSLQYVEVGQFNTSNVTDMSRMFFGLKSPLYLSGFNTGKVTNMQEMFYGYIMESLDLSSFNTANVTNMKGMFAGAQLKSLDLSKFNTANVTDMSHMFDGVWMKELDLTSFNTSNVTNMNGMFQSSHLSYIDLNSFDITNVTNMNAMFLECRHLTAIHCEKAWSISDPEQAAGMFEGCRFLSGDKGTVCDWEQNTGIEYARLDGMDGKPGYFSHAHPALQPVVYTEFIDKTLTYYYDNQYGMRDGTPEKYIPGKPHFKDYHNAILIAIIDPSMKNARLESTKTMFYGGHTYTLDENSLKNLKKIQGMENLVTDEVTDMSFMFYCCKSLEAIDFSSFNTSNVQDMNCMFAHCESLKSLNLYKFLTDNVRNMANMFSSCTSLESLAINTAFDTRKVTNMRYMFSSCKSLKSLDLSAFITSNVTDMSNMFEHCSSLKSLDLSSFNTSNVTDMSGMFAECMALETVNLSKFNTANVTTMSEMFYRCKSLKSLNFKSFNTSNVKYMVGMFKECFSLKSLDLSMFNTANVTHMSEMFDCCKSLKSIDLSSFNTSKVTSMRSMFGGCFDLKSLDLTSFSFAKVDDLYEAFFGCGDLTTILCSEDLSKRAIHISSGRMFILCNKLKGGNGTKYDEDKTDIEYARPDGVGGKPGYFTAVTEAYTVFDEATGTLTYYYDNQRAAHDGKTEVYTPEKGQNTLRFSGYADKVKKAVIDASFKNATMTTLSHMFDGDSEETHLSALETIEGMENINYAPVTNTYEMFNGCASLKSIDLDWFSPANLTIMEGMFAGCSSLETLDLVHFNTYDVTSMYRLFEGCSSLKSVNLNSFDTSEVENMISMFKGCSSLEKLDLRLFDTGNVKSMTSLFQGCSSLKAIDLKKFNTSNVSAMALMFNGCSSLESIDLRSFNTISATNMSYMFKDCRKLAFLDLGSFNTTNMKDMIRMFAGCTSLKTVYANSDWGKSTILVNSEGMFEGCTSLVGGNGTKCDGTNNTGKTYARIDNGESSPGYFTVNNEVYTAYDAETGTLTYYYDNLRLFRTEQTELYDPKDNTTVRFKGYCDKVLVVEIDESMKNAELRSMHNMFFGGGEYDENLDYVRYPLTNAAEIDGLEYLNTEKVTDMNGMFNRCASIDSLDLASFNTGNVTDMNWMFSGCTKLATIRCKFHWDESGKLEQSEKMFEGCTSLVGENGTKCNGKDNIDKTYARPDKVNAPGYFTTIKEQYTVFDEETATLTYYYDDKCLEREGIVEMYTPTKGDAIRFEGYAEKIKKAVIHKSYRHLIKKSLACMFYGGTSSTCLAAMESVEGLENLRTEKVTDVHDMFLGCRSLKEVDVTPLITSKVKNFRRMFFECASLKELNVDGFDIRKATNMTNMFANCTSLTTIWNENSWKVSGVTSYDMFYNCPALVGGHGSEYDESHCNNEYARPDGGRKKPGYFTMTPHLERRFTVSENGDQIRFSLGNLQYNPTNNKWRFAPYQWNYMGQSNQYVWSLTYNGWLDLFCWGTGNDPLSANTNGSEYASYTEWGKNKIGSDARNTWRAPTTAEWDYIFNKRADASSKYGAAKVNDVGGLVILPDLWELPADCKFTPGMVTGGYDWYYATNVYSTTQWEKMEKAGAIFLPAGGYRYYNGNKHVYTDNVGHYWTSTPTNDIFYRAYELNFTAYSVDAEDMGTRYFGYSVRLVKDIRDIPDFTLTLTTEGSGTVTGAGRYMQDEEATLSAKAGDGWEFVKWSDENTDNPRQITMTADLTLTAVFEEIPLPDFTLTVTTEGEGSVTGAGTYKLGELVKLTAKADEGWEFSQWDDGNTDNPRLITVTDDQTLNAVFKKLTYTLTVNMEGKGTVTGAGTYTHGEVITLEATAGEGYEFSQWSDGNTDNPRQITITDNLTLTAVFTSVQPEELEALPEDETTTFDFSLIDPNGSKMLGVTLDAKDQYNAEEGCMEVTSTNTAEEIDTKLNAVYNGTATIKPFLPGTIIFKLGQGEGKIEIDCQTVPGYTLQVRIAEYGTAYITSTIEQAQRGKATVSYNVTQDTYVVIYLGGAPDSAPARIAHSEEEEGAGAYIWSITIIPAKTATGIEAVENSQSTDIKFVKDGILYILHDGRLFNAQGKELR